MKLINFSVTNFRSITAAHKIPLSGLTVIIGKNNEGKSNILKALNVAMNVLATHATLGSGRIIRPRRYMATEESSYMWERDFPIALQARTTSRQSIFRLEFTLTTAEVDEFRDEIHSYLNGSLPIEIKIGPDERASIRVAKKGPGQEALSKKSQKIAQFVARKLNFNYIPAVRTDKDAVTVIRRMLSNELSVLEQNTAYLNAMNTIKELQKPILDELATKIKDSLTQFIPSVSDVDIQIPENETRVALRNEIEVTINDGARTRIEFKGDGVKSLAALALLKNPKERSEASITAIEEPECHLHPGAVHQLKTIISELSGDSQVLISTHNPLFVNREKIGANIIIDNGLAKPARQIREIRDVLGVRASDNLTNAAYVLIVEGQDDVISITALLKHLSVKISKTLENGFLIVKPLGGASNLSYVIKLYSDQLCEPHVFLDDDDAGRSAFNKANADGELTLRQTTFTNCQGMANSELEDCLNADIYKQPIMNLFGVTLDVPEFRSDKKWSDRVELAFRRQGKLWSDNIEANVKQLVAKCVSETPSNALNPHKRHSVDALVNALERYLST